MIGKVAKCSKGLIGLIEGQKELPWGLAWVGKRVKDGEPWSSRKPEVVANSLSDFRIDLVIRAGDKVKKLFGGLDGFTGSGIGMLDGIRCVALRFSKKPHGVKVPATIDVDGFDVPIDYRVVKYSPRD